MLKRRFLPSSHLPIVCIMVAAAAARAWLLFGTPYMPGMNGAYYLVQARSLMERGVLGIPDMPLTFHLHAAVAWLLASLIGMEQADAIVRAVKLCDAVLPPLAAWPVFLLVRRWAKSRGLSDAVPLSAASLACLAPPWLGMAGDLEKNALALVWLAGLAASLHAWLDAPTRWRGVAVLGCLLLLGFTHIGVLGAAVVLIASVMLAYVSLQGFKSWRRVLPWMAAGMALLAIASALVFWRFDPARIQRLMTALTNPLKFSSDGLQMPGPPGGAVNAVRWLPSIGFAVAVVPALIVVWRRRTVLPAADAALAAGAALTVLAMTGPWFSMDKAMRFNLIGLQPAILAAAFAVLNIASPWRRGCVLLAVLAVGAAGTVSSLKRGGIAILNDEAMCELQSLARYIEQPDRTLVCARHGAEWWSAWFLRTRIAQPGALRREDWQSYSAVYFLQIKSGIQMPHGPGGGPPPGFWPPGADSMNPMLLPPPAGGANPMMSAPIPPGAEILHDGACLKFARIASPPDDIPSRVSK